MTRAEFITRLADKLGHLPTDEVKAAVLAITDRLGLHCRTGAGWKFAGSAGFRCTAVRRGLAAIREPGRLLMWQRVSPSTSSLVRNSGNG